MYKSHHQKLYYIRHAWQDETSRLTLSASQDLRSSFFFLPGIFFFCQLQRIFSWEECGLPPFHGLERRFLFQCRDDLECRWGSPPLFEVLYPGFRFSLRLSS